MYVFVGVLYGFWIGCKRDVVGGLLMQPEKVNLVGQ